MLQSNFAQICLFQFKAALLKHRGFMILNGRKYMSLIMYLNIQSPFTQKTKKGGNIESPIQQSSFHRGLNSNMVLAHMVLLHIVYHIGNFIII